MGLNVSPRESVKLSLFRRESRVTSVNMDAIPAAPALGPGTSTLMLRNGMSPKRSPITGMGRAWPDEGFLYDAFVPKYTFRPRKSDESAGKGKRLMQF